MGPDSPFWSRSYCLLSARAAPNAIIRRYIQNQGPHKN